LTVRLKAFDLTGNWKSKVPLLGGARGIAVKLRGKSLNIGSLAVVILSPEG